MCHPHIIPVTCMSSPWSLKTRDDIGDHIYHQHIIRMSSPWSLMWSPLTQVIHRLFPLSQMWSPLSEVIHRLSLWSLMWFPLTEVILHYSHMNGVHTLIIPVVPGPSAHYFCSLQRLEMTLVTTYIISMSSTYHLHGP